MLRVFNCGIGMVLIVPSEEASDILDRIHALGERAYRIGEIDVRTPDDPPLHLGPLAD
jgi:phosphoribosylformylglycinamidine cyclo-ligase